MSSLRYIFLLVVFMGQLVSAEESDCPDGGYTESHTLDFGGQVVAYQMLDKKGGNYVVTFDNGDMLIALFSQCGPGEQVDYYSRKLLTKELRIRRLSWMLDVVRPSREDLKQQLTKWPNPVDDQVMSITDDGESHDFVFRRSESPLYKTALHYTWNPPEY